MSASCRIRYRASCTAAGGCAARRGVDVDPQFDTGRAHLGVELFEVGEGGLRTRRPDCGAAGSAAAARRRAPRERSSISCRAPRSRRAADRPMPRTARRPPGRSRPRASARRRRACHGRSAPAPARPPPRPRRAPAPRGWHARAAPVRTRAPTVHASSSANAAATRIATASGSVRIERPPSRMPARGTGTP